MKTRLFFMAFAGVALASCVNETVSDVEQKDEKALIAFDTPLLYNNSESRANVFGEYKGFTYDGNTFSYPKTEDFVVYSNVYLGEFSGWDTSNNYWTTPNITVSHRENANGWRAETLYYWPYGKKLTFAAYSPADLTPFKSYNEGTKTGTVEDGYNPSTLSIDYDADGLSITGFKVPDDPTYQYELLYSERSYNNSANQSGEYNGAPISFRHALSSVHFALKKDVDIDVKLKKIEVLGAKAMGDFNEHVDETNPIVYSSAPAWTNQSDPTDYVAYDSKTTTGIEFPQLTAEHVVGLSNTVADDEAHSLLLLPQMLQGHNVKLKVTYLCNSSF